MVLGVSCVTSRAEESVPPVRSKASRPAGLANERPRNLLPLSAAPVFVRPPVKVRVSNFTGRGVEIIWMRPDGADQHCGMVPPTAPGGAPALLDTWGGRLWLFKSEGRVLKVFAAGNEAVQDVQIEPLPAVPREDPAGEAAAATRVEPGAMFPPPPAPIIIIPPSPPEIPEEMADAPENAHEFLRVHNEERARLGLPPLRWSRKLARHAQTWANHLASTGTFEHRDRGLERCGENLFRGSEGYSPADAARRWLEERSLYRGGPVAREDLRTVGHYTQMVWQETTHVGFGFARGRKGLVVVANYLPGGNREGKIPYEVTPRPDR